MTPVTQPTEHDFELLSAYLDDDLPASERAALEARLEQETTLRVVLDELRLTLRILKAAPPLVPPRNFTLDPARYRRPAPWWTRYRMMQLVGAVGTFASILLVAIGVLSFSMVGNRAAAPSDADIALLPTSVATNPIGFITTVTPRMTATAHSTTSPVVAEAAGAAEKPSPTGTMPLPIPLLTATQVAGLSVVDQLTATANTSLATDPKAVNPQPGQGVPEAMTEAAQNAQTTPPLLPPLQGGQQAATQVYRQATQISIQQATAPFSTPAVGDSQATMTALPNIQVAPLTRTATPAPTSAPTSVALQNDQAGGDKAESPTVAPREEVQDSTQSTLAPAPTAVASRASSPASADNAPPILLIIGVALFLFSIMLFGIGWLRSRL